MANALGYVTETETGFEGTLAMMSLSTPIRIVKNSEKIGDTQPDFRIYAGTKGSDIGGGWLRKAKILGTQICLANPCRPGDWPAQNLCKPSPGQRQERASRDPLEPQRLTLSTARPSSSNCRVRVFALKFIIYQSK